MKSSFFILTMALFFLTGKFYSQSGFERINIQGQFFTITSQEGVIAVDVFVLNQDSDTLWHEQHSSVLISDDNSFTLSLGDGEYISGSVPSLAMIDWTSVSQVLLLPITTSSPIDTLSISINTLPYAFHSLHNLDVPIVSELEDTPPEEPTSGAILKYDSGLFSYQEDLLGDSIGFSLITDNSLYSLVTANAYFMYLDTSVFSFQSDTAYWSLNTINAQSSDTSTYANFTDIASFSAGNWSLLGNANSDSILFLGSQNVDSLTIKTNSEPRLSFWLNNMTNTNIGSGLSLNSSNGILFMLDTGQVLSSIPYNHMYFNGNNSFFHGGSLIDGLDTLQGEYSFSWGNNVGTNGMYSTVFGKNTFGDSVSVHNSYSSFANGDSCRVTRICVAIGQNARANHYRNVAIGKDVHAGIGSAAIAFGNNVESTGATAWAFGKNVTASGFFSTVMGTNASTNSQVGSFVYGDNSTTDTIFSTANNQFIVRAEGGAVFYSSIDTTMGVKLLSGAGSWEMVSDRDKKRYIHRIREGAFKNSFAEISIPQWNYISEKEQHVGPIAQDFNAVFKVGELDNYINMIDIDGVTLLGIKKMNKKIDKELEKGDVSRITKAIQYEGEQLNILEQKIKEIYEKIDN